ncbi:MAG TPA: methyl-accepting chemotaxis protein, partial [Pseudomonas sp.]|nr:methyl-accepting chemotaxis protein [Pseudomonas sp.]
MRLPKLSLRLTLVLSVGAILLASGVGVTLAGWTTMRSQARVQASEQAKALMEGYGERIGKEVGQAIKNASVGAATVESLAADPSRVDRDQIGRTFIHLVQNNPDIIGMTPVFEPNGLDGRDADFTTHPYSDASGRFVPYFVWGPDKTVKTDKLVMTAEAGIDAWYTKPMTENRTLLTAPYVYPVNGKQVLMT